LFDDDFSLEGGDTSSLNLSSPCWIGFTPKPLTIAPSQEATVQVRVEGAKDLYGISIQLIFNPPLIEIVQVAEGTFLNSDGMETRFAPSIDNQNKRLGVDLRRTGQVKGIDGSGTLFTITFRALTKGICDIKLGSVSLQDSKLKPILSNFGKGRIRIQ